jgi:hypothetical protein
MLGYGNFAHAQDVLQARIKDAKTNSAIPYVNIGVLQTGRGTVSDKHGFFKLRIDSTSDTLMVSAIGYNTRRLKIKEALKTKEILLIPKVYEMKGLVVTAKMRKGKDEIFGSNPKRHGGGIGFVEGEQGDELGALIKIRKPVYLKSAHFIVNKIAGDSMLFRVNIYDYSGHQLGENLLKQNVLLHEKQKIGTVSVDLSKLNLIVKNDILLTLEFIKVDSNTKYGVLFKYYGYLHKSGNIYMRYTSNSKNVGGEFRKMLEVDLGFYLVGNELR